MARSVFYGVGAFIGSITGPTNVAFWPDDPAKLKWAQDRRVQVDLANNPEAVRQGKLAQADVDDYFGYGTGGLTRVGPMFPRGSVLGPLYLEAPRCGDCGAQDPTKDPRKYEWATGGYYDGPMAGRRFHGFHGSVVNVNGGMALISLWARGTSAVAAGPMGTYWLDIANHLHPDDKSLPAVALAKSSQGGVFIDSKAGGGGETTIDSPNNPKWTGGVPAPESRRVR